MKAQGMPTIITLMLVVLLSSPGLLPAGQHSQTSTHVLEIRSYNLKPGVRDRFQKRFVEESLPLLMKYKVDVVAYGPSLHDSDSWFLMRSYASIEDRQRSEDRCVKARTASPLPRPAHPVGDTAAASCEASWC